MLITLLSLKMGFDIACAVDNLFDLLWFWSFGEWVLFFAIEWVVMLVTALFLYVIRVIFCASKRAIANKKHTKTVMSNEINVEYNIVGQTTETEVKETKKTKKTTRTKAVKTKPGNITVQLEELKNLLDEGYITQEDYDAKKKQILGI